MANGLAKALSSFWIWSQGAFMLPALYSGAALPHFGRDGKDADTCFFA